MKKIFFENVEKVVKSAKFVQNVELKNYTAKDKNTDELQDVEQLTITLAPQFYDGICNNAVAFEKTKSEAVCELYRIQEWLDVLGVKEEVKNQYLKDDEVKETSFFYLYFPKESKTVMMPFIKGDEEKMVEIFSDTLQSVDLIIKLKTTAEHQWLEISAFGKLQKFIPAFQFQRINGALKLTDEEKKKMEKAKETAERLKILQSF